MTLWIFPPNTPVLAWVWFTPSVTVICWLWARGWGNNKAEQPDAVLTTVHELSEYLVPRMQVWKLSGKVGEWLALSCLPWGPQDSNLSDCLIPDPLLMCEPWVGVCAWKASWSCNHYPTPSSPWVPYFIHSYTAEPTVSLGPSRSRASPDQRSCYFHPLAGAVQAFLQELPRASYQSPGVFPGNPEFSVEALRLCYYGEHFSSQSERNSNFYSSKQEISSCICQIH